MANSYLEHDLIEHLHDYIDKLCRRELFKDLDNDLKEIQPDEWPTNILLTILVATLPAKSKLTARQKFVERVEAAILLRYSCRETQDLLYGLK